MAEIKILDQDTINQIAAGEVVERPSSIVKELIENAVDAASTAITVEIRGGGIDFIRITDNGCGIDKDQIRNAFLPHATSKIRHVDDLTTVHSLGFRGEALASISAVAKVETVTKTDQGIAGVRYVIEGGEEICFEEVGCPEGTTFLVRNLFYNTPARRKFLKSKMTEAGYVEAFMQRLALSRPDIAFRFINENRNKMATSGNGNLKDVIYHIFGREIAGNLLPADYEENGIRVEGFVGKPVISRGNRNYEHYYVNGRYLKNNIISRAIEDGYKGHAMIHKFPFTVLMISMDPHQVDVNVHPSKMEMRFHNGEDLYMTLVAAVKNSFVKKELIPKVRPGRETREKTTPPPAPEPFEKKRAQIEQRFSSLSEEQKKQILDRKKEADQAADNRDRNRTDRVKPVDYSQVRKEIDTAMPVKDGGLGENTVRENDRQGTGRQNPGSQETYTQMNLADLTVLKEEFRPKHRIIGQVFDTYWLFEYQDQLYFVDQHAAHEKVMYEKLMKEMAENTVHQQMLAPPVVLTFNMKEEEKLKNCLDAFARLGFLIEEFGGNDYCIRAVPADLLGMDEKSFFMELFDQMEENTGKMNLDVITGRVATMACKAAVKGNTKMSIMEMNALMDQLMTLENPYQCPHGRPTLISMSRYELEKKFRRVQN